MGENIIKISMMIEFASQMIYVILWFLVLVLVPSRRREKNVRTVFFPSKYLRFGTQLYNLYNYLQNLDFLVVQIFAFFRNKTWKD